MAGIEEEARELAQQLAVAPRKERLTGLREAVADARSPRPGAQQAAALDEPLRDQRLKMTAYGL